MNLSEYVKKKNGVPIGHPSSLRNNLQRSLGARNFSAFWNFWNPIFGYYLGKKVFKPIKRKVPVGIAVVLTFVFCGLIHDLVTTLVKRELSLLFTIWFLIMGIVVVISRHINYNLSHKKWIFRALVNLSIITVCLLLTIFLDTIFNFY